MWVPGPRSEAQFVSCAPSKGTGGKTIVFVLRLHLFMSAMNRALPQELLGDSATGDHKTLAVLPRALVRET